MLLFKVQINVLPIDEQWEKIRLTSFYFLILALFLIHRLLFYFRVLAHNHIKLLTINILILPLKFQATDFILQHNALLIINNFGVYVRI